MRFARPLLLMAVMPLLAATADQRATLDRLSGALAVAPDEQAAAAIEQAIGKLLLNAGSPAVTLLMSRGTRALQAGETDDAVEAFTDAITLDPSLAEAYHRRAIARWHAGDTKGAAADLDLALLHEPRDVAALRSLADFAEARGDWKGACTAWRRLLAVDPKTPNGAARLKDARRHLQGEET